MCSAAVLHTVRIVLRAVCSGNLQEKQGRHSGLQDGAGGGERAGRRLRPHGGRQAPASSSPSQAGCGSTPHPPRQSLGHQRSHLELGVGGPLARLLSGRHVSPTTPFPSPGCRHACPISSLQSGSLGVPTLSPCLSPAPPPGSTEGPRDLRTVGSRLGGEKEGEVTPKVALWSLPCAGNQNFRIIPVVRPPPGEISEASTVRPPPRSGEQNQLGLGWGMSQGGPLSREGRTGWDGGWLGVEERRAVRGAGGHSSDSGVLARR